MVQDGHKDDEDDKKDSNILLRIHLQKRLIKLLRAMYELFERKGLMGAGFDIYCVYMLFTMRELLLAASCA